MFSPSILQKATRLLAICKEKGILLSGAESCTGGLIMGALTAVAGSSAAVDRGFVTYSNAAKNEILGVPSAMLDEFGAVSAEVAEAMATGSLENSRAHWAFSVTGIAGPGGGSAEKPVGLVYMGWAGPRHVGTLKLNFNGDRDSVRNQTIETVLQELILRISREG